MLGDRLYLVWNYGKTHLVLGGLYNLACAAAFSRAFSPMLAVDGFIIKGVVAALVFYLISQFRSKDSVFFYINLGLSRRKLDVAVLVIDFSFYIILMIAASLVAHLTV